MKEFFSLDKKSKIFGIFLNFCGFVKTNFIFIITLSKEEGFMSTFSPFNIDLILHFKNDHQATTISLNKLKVTIGVLLGVARAFNVTHCRIL